MPPKVDNTVYNFKRLEEIPASDSVSILGYGGSGTGKTWFAATAGTRTLFINNGNGIATIKSKKFRDRYPNTNPIVFTPEVPILTDPTRSINSIRNGINKALDEFGKDFDTIVVDDSTQLRDSVMCEALKFNQDTNRSKTLTDLVTRGYKYQIPAVQDYGTEMEFISGWMNELVNDIGKREKKHIIVLAHERMTWDKPKNIGEQPKLIRITPSFTGVDRNPDYISGLFDNVWHFETKGGGDRTFYNIRTEGDENLTAKTRNGGLFNVIEKAEANKPLIDFPEVVRRIKESDNSTNK
jgi:hypothetical protein